MFIIIIIIICSVMVIVIIYVSVIIIVIVIINTLLRPQVIHTQTQTFTTGAPHRYVP